MTVGLILISAIAATLLISLLYLLITQRFDTRKTLEQMMDTTQKSNQMAEGLIRLALQSSNSQSADMTDMMAKIARNQTEFLEQVTLGREQPMPDSLPSGWSPLEEKSDDELLRNVQMPSNIQEAMEREAAAEAMMMHDPSRQHLPSHLNRQQFASEMNGASDLESEVEITPF
jgi:hypothetical protein